MAALLVKVLIIATVLVTLINAQQSGCDLSEHDLNVDALRLIDPADAWYATIPEEACINKTMNGQTCGIYFTICQPLPPSKCDGTTDSGICQVIQDSNQTPPNIAKSYELGKTSSKLTVNATREGFSIAYTTNTANPHCKNGSIVVIDFKCSPDAIWSSDQLNVTGYLLEFFAIPADTCLYTAAFNYSGACIQPVPVEPAICNLVHYNGTALKSKPNGWLMHFSTTCYDPRMSANSLRTSSNPSVVQEESCLVFASFCDKLPTSYCANSMICEVFIGDTHASYSFAEYRHGFTYKEDENGKGFQGIFSDGSKVGNCSDGLSATVNFVCDPKADWNKLPDNNITKYAVAIPVNKDCQYFIKVNYSGACGAAFSEPFEGPSPVGWILMGLFIVIVLAYFLIGMAVQFVRGKRGVEVIPNFQFWKAFPLLVINGFRFCVDTVTCYKVKTIGGGGGESKVTEYDKL